MRASTKYALHTIHFPYEIVSAVGKGDALYLGTLRWWDENTCIRKVNSQFKDIWKTPIDYTPVGIIVASDRVLVVSRCIQTSRGKLYCFCSVSGELKWSISFRPRETLEAIYRSGESVIGIGNYGIAKYSMSNGKIICAVKPSLRSPKISADGTVILGCADGMLFKRRCDDLGTVWSVPAPRYNRALGISSNHAFVSDDNVILEYDLYTGKRCGTIQSEGYSAILADDDALFFQSYHDNSERYEVGCYLRGRRDFLWKTNVPFDISGCPYDPEIVLLTDRALIVRANLGPVYSLDRQTGAIKFFLAEGDMPDNRFSSQNSPPLFYYQGRFHIQYGKTVYVLGDFPSVELGSQLRDHSHFRWFGLDSPAERS